MKKLLFALASAFCLLAPADAAPPTPLPMPVVTACYYATVEEIHDGDTLRLSIEFDARVILHAAPVRLLNVYAVELAAPSGDKARANLATLIPVGTRLVVHLLRTTKGSADPDVETFGRLICALWRDKDGLDICAAQATWLQANGLWGGTGTK